MGTVFIDQLKMRVSVCSLPVLSTALILLLQAHQQQALFLPAAALPAIPAAPVVISLPVLAGVAALGVLAKLNVELVTIFAARLALRGKRSVTEEREELELDLKLLAKLEPEQCFKRVICAANTGKYNTHNLDGIMSLINEKATDLRASKFLAAAQYGSLAKDVAKCEHRYQCSMDLEIIKTVF